MTGLSRRRMDARRGMNERPAHRRAAGTKRIADVDQKRVLVIDDDLPLRGMLAAALRQHGFQVLLAGDGAEGQRALTIHNPDVVLLDLAMPDVNGWDFLQRLQETGHLGTRPDHRRLGASARRSAGDPADGRDRRFCRSRSTSPELIDLIEHLSP